MIRRSTGQRLLSGAKQVGKEILLSPINAVEGLWAPLQNMGAGAIGKIAGSGVAAYEGNIKHSPDWGVEDADLQATTDRWVRSRLEIDENRAPTGHYSLVDTPDGTSADGCLLGPSVHQLHP